MVINALLSAVVIAEYGKPGAEGTTQLNDHYHRALDIHAGGRFCGADSTGGQRFSKLDVGRINQTVGTNSGNFPGMATPSCVCTG